MMLIKDKRRPFRRVFSQSVCTELPGDSPPENGDELDHRLKIIRQCVQHFVVRRILNLNPLSTRIIP